LNSGPCACQADALPSEPHLSPSTDCCFVEKLSFLFEETLKAFWLLGRFLSFCLVLIILLYQPRLDFLIDSHKVVVDVFISI
jgi:hypothetical protein